MKKAFSLIELMIVIVIIGVIYTLAVVKLKDVKADKMHPTLANLKEYLYSLNKDGETVRLLCFEDCSECSIYQDDNKIATIKHFFDADVAVYRYDFLQGAIEEKMPLFFDKEGIQKSLCFSFRVDKNRVADQVMVVYKDKTYDYSNYFEKTKIYDSLEEAVDAKQKLAQEVMQ